MKYLDLTLPTPADNLARDEELLDAAEHGRGGAVLRTWESPEVFVVAGYSQKFEKEVNLAECEKRGIPVLRRSSGGGAVLQGPGCLSYALILPITANGPLRNVTTANQFIMERNRAAVQSAIGNRQSAIQIQGCVDLTLDNLKFSGNSQRRRKHWLLFHGTFLLDFDLSLISELLPMPSRQPDYRASRPHEKFLTNLDLPADTMKSALKAVWLKNDL